MTVCVCVCVCVPLLKRRRAGLGGRGRSEKMLDVREREGGREQVRDGGGREDKGGCLVVLHLCVCMRACV